MRPLCVALVSCSAGKASQPAPARHLYTSQLFRTQLSEAERLCPGRVLVLSALHGAVDPDAVLAPYDFRMEAYSLEERREWGHTVLRHVEAWLENRWLLTDRVELKVYAGAAYAEPLRWQLPSWPGWDVKEPLAGLQVGQRLQRLAQERRAAA